MWEQPRPERLRHIESKRRREVVSSIIAYAIIFGVTAVLLYAGVIDWRGGPGEETALPAPTSRPSPPAAPTPPQHRPGATVNRTAPERVNPEPATRSFGPTNTARGDPSVLRTLTDTCRYWLEQNTRGQYSGNQEVACRDMTQYARTHGYAVPSIGGSGPRLPSSTRDASPARGVSVAVEQCEGYEYGSIGYRQCRAGEKRRLADWCKSLRTRRDT
ncbi:MAG TPA: hypothetical protein VMQ83_14160, partial [Gammaproteobacteria bacterium]|nr:hypothetical protein [Gammaproteobacteria bacterium]